VNAPVEGPFVEDGNSPAVVRVLPAAVTRPFCPETEEQVMGLTRGGELLRSRTQWHGEPAWPAPDHKPRRRVEREKSPRD
jgi:hypothetical protein